MRDCPRPARRCQRPRPQAGVGLGLHAHHATGRGRATRRLGSPANRPDEAAGAPWTALGRRHAQRPPPHRTDLAMDFEHHHQTLVGASTASTQAVGRAYPKQARRHHPDVSNGPCVEASCNGENDGIGAIGDVERWPACGTTADHRDGRPRRTSRGLADSRSDSSPWSRPRARTTASRSAAAVAMPIATIFSVHRSANAAALTAFHRVRRPQAPGPKPGGPLRLLGRDHPGTPPCDANAQRVLPLSAPGGAHAPAWPGIAPPFTASAPATLP